MMMETENKCQSNFYEEVTQCVDCINNSTDRIEATILKNVEKIVLNNQGNELKMIDELCIYFRDLRILRRD